MFLPVRCLLRWTIELPLFLVALFAFISPSSPSVARGEGQPLQRSKRHLFQMCDLVAHHTNRGCLDYNNYGCFCGLGNAASHHVDAVDGCCRVHDRCYGQVSCYFIYPQFVGYTYRCDEKGCTCTDSSIFSPCAYTTCQCDLQFAQCLERAEFNPSFRNYDREQCNRPNNRTRPVRTRPARIRQQRRRRKAKAHWATSWLRRVGSKMWWG